MHKPLRIIRDDARVRLTQQVNLTSAIRTALLTLPESFEEHQLFERIAALSYQGDLRMALPFENRSKITNIVSAQTPQFKELYYRLVVGLPGVDWAQDSTTIKQDGSPQTRAAHVRKLPSELRSRIETQYAGKAGFPSKDSDEPAYWARLAGDSSLPGLIQSGTCYRICCFTQLILFQRSIQPYVIRLPFKPPRVSSHQASEQASSMQGGR